jgi:hypothetical protein
VYFSEKIEEIAMKYLGSRKSDLWPAGIALAAMLLTSPAFAAQDGRSILVLTSTNNAAGNAVVVFKLNHRLAPSLSWAETVPTGGKGGAGTNAGSLQFKDDLGVVANYGSNNVSQLVRYDNSIAMGNTINLATDCVKPDSVALTRNHLFVVGSNCAESHAWPSGNVDGSTVSLSDPSAAQIAAGENWAAVTLTSGSVLQLPLTANDGALSGISENVALPSNANNTPLGAAFWKNILGFTPAHSPDSFAVLDENRNVFPIPGPTPPFPANAPCWVAKGPGNVWYTGNSPGHVISIFFSDGQGGVFYRSVSLPGAPTDLTVSVDQKWLAVIYTEGSEAHVSVFAIDAYGDLTLVATSSSLGVPAFNGVAISQ